MKGVDFVLLVHDGVSTFNQVGALRGTSFSINGEVIDVTSKDSAGRWRELLAGGGRKTLTISADGVWEGTTHQQTVRDLARDGDLRDFQIDDGVEVLEGAFAVSGWEQDGPEEGEDTYSLTLESADQPTIT